MTAPGHTTGLAAEVVRGATGAEASHAALFERVIGRIYRYFRRMVWDRGEAEDLAQETLLLLERSLRERSYDPSRSFNAWMWLKAHTVFCQWCRKRERRLERLPSGEEPETPCDDLAAAADRLDAKAVLQEVERRLGTEAYECFVLYYQGGLSQSEVAEITGRNRKTVAARLAACHALAERLLDPR